MIEKEKRFIEIFKNTGDLKLAQRVVYAGQKSPNDFLRHNKGLKKTIQDILRRQGLGEKKLAQKLTYIVDTETNNEVLLRALDMGFKLHGSYAPAQVEIQSDFDIWRHLTVDELKTEIRTVVAELESYSGS